MTGDAKDFAALPEGRQGNLNGNYGSWVVELRGFSFRPLSSRYLKNRSSLHQSATVGHIAVIAKAPTKWESLANIGHSHL